MRLEYTLVLIVAVWITGSAISTLFGYVVGRQRGIMLGIQQERDRLIESEMRLRGKSIIPGVPGFGRK